MPAKRDFLQATQYNLWLRLFLNMNVKLYEAIVKKKPFLFWYIKDKSQLSEKAVVEAILNYGDFDDFHHLCKILGIQKVADIFFHLIQQPRTNLKKSTINFFKLYFKRHVPEYPQ